MTGNSLNHSGIQPILTLRNSSFSLHIVFNYGVRTSLTMNSNYFSQQLTDLSL